MSTYEGGPWYDLEEGKLLIGRAAYEQRLTEGSYGVVELAKLITNKEFTCEPIAQGELSDPQGLTEQDAVAYGRWLQRIVRRENKPAITKAYLSRAQALGIGPAEDELLTATDTKTLKHFKEKLQLNTTNSVERFRDLAPEDIVRRAKELAARLGRRPTEDDYVKAARDDPENFPSPLAISKHMTLTDLNWRIGYYTSSQGWEAPDYVTFGVRVKQANGGVPITPTVIVDIAAAKRGPSDNSIRTHFGRWVNFESQVDEQYAAEEKRRTGCLENYRKRILEGTLPETLAQLDEDHLLRVGGVWTLVEYILPSTPIAVKSYVSLSEPASVMQYLVEHSQDMDDIDIEDAARALNVYDDIWPPFEGIADSLKWDQLRASRTQEMLLAAGIESKTVTELIDRAMGHGAIEDRVAALIALEGIIPKLAPVAEASAVRARHEVQNTFDPLELLFKVVTETDGAAPCRHNASQFINRLLPGVVPPHYTQVRAQSFVQRLLWRLHSRLPEGIADTVATNILLHITGVPDEQIDKLLYKKSGGQRFAATRRHRTLALLKDTFTVEELSELLDNTSGVENDTDTAA